jgi:hypothetical protein
VDAELSGRRAAIDRERDGLDRGSVSQDIRASWDRCRLVIDTEHDAAPVADDGVVEQWEASPIRRAVPGLVEQLAEAGRDAGLLAIVTDPIGRVLWESAPAELRRHAEGVGLIPGGRWDETAAGTNGIGMALVTGRPSAVFATEHWCSPVREWVCYSAPVRTPDGHVAGVIDLSTTWDRANPLGLGTISAFAGLMEAELAKHQVAIRPHGLELFVLGRPRATLNGARIALTPRQVELLVALAVVGVASLDELHALVFGDRPVSRTTVRAEISHLRDVLGGAIASRPYRLTLPCHVDALEILDQVRLGDLEGAVGRYSGPLLPSSDAPLIVERRYHLDVALRTALLLSGSTAQLLRFAGVHTSDVEVLQRAVAVAAADDPDLPAAVAALAVATADLAL